MKNLVFTLLILSTLFSCSQSKKETLPAPETEAFRVSAIGTDTARTPWMFARTETVGIVIVEDSRLKAELMSYTPLPGKQAIYEVKVTSKLGCQGIIRWNYEDLALEDIQPNDNTANTAQSDVMKAGTVKTFLLTGKAHVGKIILKIFSDCGNSSTLIIPITMDVLPIIFLESKTVRDDKRRPIITFTVDDPAHANWYLIERMKGKEVSQAALIESDKKTKSFTIKL